MNAILWVGTLEVAKRAFYPHIHIHDAFKILIYLLLSLLENYESDVIILSWDGTRVPWSNVHSPSYKISLIIQSWDCLQEWLEFEQLISRGQVEKSCEIKDKIHKIN